MTGPTGPLAHDTIVLTREFPHSPARVFTAYADVEQRLVWSAPSAEEFVEFDSHDFRIGGTDEFRCGMREARDSSFRGVTRYEDIVDDAYLVFTERLVSASDDLLAMSLVTWAIEPTTAGCRVTITDQVTSVQGDGPIEGSRHGYGAMLDQLERFLGPS